MAAIKRICLILTLATALSAQADTLLLEGISMDSTTATERPRRGMSMDNVEARYGAPSARVSAIGTPPISRWEYPSFVVYFEYDHVVHAAVRH